jgi:hypothetical protein
MVTKYEYTNRVEYRDENGVLHREDGPALIYNNGEENWYKRGRLHRENGLPAIIKKEYKLYMVNGRRHNEYGPGYENIDGTVWWYLNNIKYIEEEQYQKELIKLKLKRLVDL